MRSLRWLLQGRSVQKNFKTLILVFEANSALSRENETKCVKITHSVLGETFFYPSSSQITKLDRRHARPRPNYLYKTAIIYLFIWYYIYKNVLSGLKKVLDTYHGFYAIGLGLVVERTQNIRTSNTRTLAFPNFELDEL